MGRFAVVHRVFCGHFQWYVAQFGSLRAFAAVRCVVLGRFAVVHRVFCGHFQCCISQFGSLRAFAAVHRVVFERLDNHLFESCGRSPWSLGMRLEAPGCGRNHVSLFSQDRWVALMVLHPLLQLLQYLTHSHCCWRGQAFAVRILGSVRAPRDFAV